MLTPRSLLVLLTATATIRLASAICCALNETLYGGLGHCDEGSTSHTCCSKTLGQAPIDCMNHLAEGFNIYFPLDYLINPVGDDPADCNDHAGVIQCVSPPPPPSPPGTPPGGDPNAPIPITLPSGPTGPGVPQSFNRLYNFKEQDGTPVRRPARKPTAQPDKGHARPPPPKRSAFAMGGH